MASRQYEWQLRQKAAGRCLKCGAPRPAGESLYCKRHRKYHTDYERRRRAKARA